MKITNLSTLRELIQISDSTAAVSVRIIFRIPGDFVNKITEMQHKIKSLILWTCFIFKNHSPVSIHCSFVRTLARYKGETYGCIRIVSWCSDGTTDPACETMLI